MVQGERWREDGLRRVALETVVTCSATIEDLQFH